MSNQDQDHLTGTGAERSGEVIESCTVETVDVLFDLLGNCDEELLDATYVVEVVEAAGRSRAIRIRLAEAV